MHTALTLLALLIQLVLAGALLIWVLAFLGFADEAHRSRRATPLGRVLVTLSVLTATLPLLLTLAVGWCRYLPARCAFALPLGLPLAATLSSGLLCAGLIYLVRNFGYGRPR